MPVLFTSTRTSSAAAVGQKSTSQITDQATDAKRIRIAKGGYAATIHIRSGIGRSSYTTSFIPLRTNDLFDILSLFDFTMKKNSLKSYWAENDRGVDWTLELY